jgi:hypothetical protein
VSLGLKQKLTNPWEQIETKYPVGTKVKGHGGQPGSLWRIRGA